MPADITTVCTPPALDRHRVLGAVLLGAALLGGSGCARDAETYFDCSATGRKAYVAQIMTDYYLWSDRIPELDFAAYASPEALLREMTYRELDHWSGMQPKAQRQEFFDRGRFQGLGYTLGHDDQGGLRVSWVHEGSSAGRAGLDRGALIIAVNGRRLEDMTSEELGAELAQDRVVHRVRELDGRVHDVELEQGEVEITSVKSPTVLETARGRLGYLMFTTFVRPGEDELREAFTTFRDGGVNELVIDLRYNGGGLLRTAALLGSLIDPEAAGKPLSIETYNERHSELNRERLLFEVEEGVDVDRVVFLTTGRTASASEQVINGLRPYLDVDVVGQRTLGKPVGADSWDHCEYTIAPITFHSLNAEGEGDYFDGIEPRCTVPDDLLHRLGDPEEAQLRAALRALEGRACEEAPALSPGEELAEGPIPKSNGLGARWPAALLPPGPIADLPGWY